jgi:hypothetical protein
MRSKDTSDRLGGRQLYEYPFVITEPGRLTPLAEFLDELVR